MATYTYSGSFPSSPSTGDTLLMNGVTYEYTSKGTWDVVVGTSTVYSSGTGVEISGSNEISVTSVALTTVQTAADETAQLGLTTQEGDIVVRSDENKTYVHNGGSAGTMADFTELSTPTDAVSSVVGQTGVVTAAQIKTAYEAEADTNAFTDADHTKLDGIEASADVTDATNVDAAGALMKTGGTMAGDIAHDDNVKAKFGTGNDLEIYHDGSNSFIKDVGTGALEIWTDELKLKNAAGDENGIYFAQDGAVNLYHDNSAKLATSAAGVSVTGEVLSSTGVFGLDATDKIEFDNNTHIDFVVNGNDEMRLEADGDLHVDGDVIAFSTTISDERLKTDVEVIDGALDKVKELKGVSFTYTTDGKKSAGVIAQDVEKVLPVAVTEKALPLKTGTEEVYKTVQYDALHALLIESIKELTARIEELESK